MTRPLRILYNDAWYHVMNRGINHRPIFHNVLLKLEFLSLLEDVTERFSAQIHCYCIMDNHYHLLVKTPCANLPRIMRHIDGVYTQRFHKHKNNETDGVIFRGRYKAKVVGEEEYLLSVCKYIHMNPVAAGMVKSPKDYTWSSHNGYLNKAFSEQWLVTSELKKYLDNMNSYEMFMEEEIDDEISEHYKSAIWRPILGSNEFVDRQLNQLNKATERASCSDVNLMIRRPALKQIVAVVADYYQQPEYQLLIPRRGEQDYPRRMAVYIARQAFSWEMQVIADYFNYHTLQGVSLNFRRFEKIIKKSQRIIAEYQEIVERIKAN